MTTTFQISTHDKDTKPINLWCGVEEGTETQSNVTENLFNEFIAENFPNLGKKWTGKYRRNLESQISMTRKEALHIILQLKCQEYKMKK
jgi:hypothetical protein